MSSPREIAGRAWYEARRRRYVRQAGRKTGSDRFAALGARSIVHPPALMIGPHRIHVGDDVVVHPHAFFSVVEEHQDRRYEPRLTIGDRVKIGFNMSIGCCGSVEIGDDVLIADRAFIADTYHDYRDVNLPVLEQDLADPRPVKIGAGAFLGVNCAVLAGVTIGEGAYVGANAVVTKDLPPRSVAVGNPARLVRRWDGAAWVDV